MYNSQIPWVELTDSIWNCNENDLLADMLQQWLNKNSDEQRWLQEMAYRNENKIADITDEESCRLYAASRVTSILLLRRQAIYSRDGSNYRPKISDSDYLRFHQTLGFRLEMNTAFHPFFHEIIHVRQSESVDAPIEVVDEVWPALMLGSMMYCRAGCIVTGGTDNIVKSIAEQSRIFWAYRRLNRPYEDLSCGWGSNSQWRTAFRRDYLLSDGFYFNYDGEKPLNRETGLVDKIDAAILVELVRNRCLIRTTMKEDDLYPYRYSYIDELQ